MCRLFIIPLLALLLVRTVESATNRQWIYKCCGLFQQLSENASSCVDTPWPRNFSFRTRGVKNEFAPPFDPKWLLLWLPPGVLRPTGVRAPSTIFSHKNFLPPNVAAVNSSILWSHLSGMSIKYSYWDRKFVLQEAGVVRHRKNGRGVRTTYNYCVDSIKGPLAPYAVLFRTACSFEECIRKVCAPNYVLVQENKSWTCKYDNRGYWSPRNSSYAKFIDQETPFIYTKTPFTSLPNSVIDAVVNPKYCANSTRGAVHLVPGDERSAALVANSFQNFLFSSWEVSVDFERLPDGSLRETLLYCEHARLTRGFFILLGPLTFVSTAFLLVALGAILLNARLRSTAHGWGLICHAICLLGFNAGQVFGYTMMREFIFVYSTKTSKKPDWCLGFALAMYIFLLGAASWLTALCLNIYWGFRRLRVAGAPGRSGARGGELRRFAALAAFAWGLPSALTTAVYFLQKHLSYRAYVHRFRPSFAETRTCFDEPTGITGVDAQNSLWKLVKNGTAMYYYGPLSLLILVNVACLAATLRRIQFLRRGNSVLRKDEKVPAPPGEGRRRRARSAAAAAHRLTLYVKMLLMAGLMETAVEAMTWSMTSTARVDYVDPIMVWYDYRFSYRAAGCISDLFRAVNVAWLAAPEEGYWDIISHKLHSWVRMAARIRNRKYADLVTLRD